MYGFSGYATNEYGSERLNGVFGPIVKLAMRIVQNAYNVSTIAMSRYGRNVAVMAGNIPLALMLRFRNLTLSNPEPNQNTFEL